MNEYVVTAIYISLGLLGGSWHWVKKRYFDKTTTLDFIPYLVIDRAYTLRATAAIFMAELGLATVSGVHFPHLGELWGAITTGYMADSHLNTCKSEQNGPSQP